MRDRPPAAAHAGSFVEAQDVCKAYGRIPVLFPLSFHVAGGGSLGLLGPNGSGKTTLLRMIAGVTRPSAGRLRFGGDMTNGNRPKARRIGFLGHDSYLYEDLTGEENLRFFLKLGGIEAGAMRIGQALDGVSMRRRAHERVRWYSAGMKRRLGLARLLLVEPDLVLLDEPHASLDAEGQSLVDSFVQATRSAGRCVVIASHDQRRTLDLCHQIIVLDAGHTVFQGQTEDWSGRTPMWMVGQRAQ